MLFQLPWHLFRHKLGLLIQRNFLFYCLYKTELIGVKITVKSQIIKAVNYEAVGSFSTLSASSGKIGRFSRHSLTLTTLSYVALLNEYPGLNLFFFLSPKSPPLRGTGLTAFYYLK